jgi:nucleotidyltransferase substrate binding protein (TIGR01987 family)
MVAYEQLELIPLQAIGDDLASAHINWVNDEEGEVPIVDEQDIRWKQRLNSYSKALAQLERGVDLAAQRPLSELEEQGLIQAFEFTHELAWNALKDFLVERGATSIYGSKDTVREAFRAGLIEDGETWMRMIASRNMSSHTYNRATAEEIARDVISTYIREFRGLRSTLEGLRNEAESR